MKWFAAGLALGAAILGMGAGADRAEAAALKLTLTRLEFTTQVNPTLTMVFGNDVDNDTSFQTADFVGRAWADLSDLSLIPFGAYPADQFDDTVASVTGSVNWTGSSAAFVFGFRFVEDAGEGFFPADLLFSTTSRLRGPLLWSPGNGGTFNFTIQDVEYDALGDETTYAAAVSAPTVPLPAPALLLGAGLLGLAGLRRRG